MFRSRHGIARKLAAWAAALGFALNGLVPLIAQGAADVPGLHDICTTGGVKQVDSSRGRSGSGEPAPASVHCALCALRYDITAVAPDFGAALRVVSDLRHEIPVDPRELFAGIRSNPSAPPRAPPLYS